MALNSYVAQVQQLLHDPNQQFYSTATLTTFINSARSQVALEGECVRGITTFTLTATVDNYALAALVAPAVGFGGAEAIRSIAFGSTKVLEARNWDYFDFYFRTLARPVAGPPAVWAPFQPGSNGSFFISPVPDVSTYSLLIEAIWNVIPLVDDTTIEQIPYPWSDAIQYYAAYLAYLDSQRYADAKDMQELYEEFMNRGRAGVSPLGTPGVIPGSYASRTQRGKPQPSRISIGDQQPPSGGR